MHGNFMRASPKRDRVTHFGVDFCAYSDDRFCGKKMRAYNTGMCCVNIGLLVDMRRVFAYTQPNFGAVINVNELRQT